MIDKDSRFYYIDGKSYIRTTEILTILNRPGLNRWQANLGTEAAEDYSEQMREIGSQVHSFIAQIIKGYSFCATPEDGLKYAQLDKTIRNGLKAWNQAMLSVPFKPIESELFLISKKYGYAGTTDCLARIGHRKWLLDWKCSSRLWPIEVKLQLAAYYHAYQESIGGKIEGCRAIRLDRDNGKWCPKDQLILIQPELDNTFEVFKYLLEVWRYVNKEG